MDEKEAYEVSLIENIERRTLDPIEEAEAFKRYVDDYGYGSTTELGRRIGRSEQYISGRLSLLRLPLDLREKVTRRVVTPSHIRELVGLDEELQRNITQIIVDQGISSRDVRRIVRTVKNAEDRGEPYFLSPVQDPSSARIYTITRTYSRCICALRISMMRFDEAVEQVEESEWGFREILMEQRKYLHDQIDSLLRL